MTIIEMQQRALAVAAKYKVKNQQDNHEAWDATAYMSGFVGDVGDLSKLVMAHTKLRDIPDAEAKLAHELSDCLWSILVLAHELNVDIETAFAGTMAELESRLADIHE
jgi:NTP pyrophosphatase (non-canonical NTP hydrolase)